MRKYHNFLIRPYTDELYLLLDFCIKIDAHLKPIKHMGSKKGALHLLQVSVIMTPSEHKKCLAHMKGEALLVYCIHVTDNFTGGMLSETISGWTGEEPEAVEFMQHARMKEQVYTLTEYELGINSGSSDIFTKSLIFIN